jgi:hypothetical protein
VPAGRRREEEEAQETCLSLQRPQKSHKPVIPWLTPMRARMLAWILVLPAACGHTYPLPKTDGVVAADEVDGPVKLGGARFRSTVCQGIDLSPEFGLLDERSILAFLEKQGIAVRLARVRADLAYVEFQPNPGREQWVRLRVATLGTASQAGQELYRALLEKGEGTWGVHRSNIAVLGPAGELDNVIAVAARTKLSCWGVLTVEGDKEAFVVPGAYREL